MSDDIGNLLIGLAVLVGAYLLYQTLQASTAAGKATASSYQDAAAALRGLLQGSGTPEPQPETPEGFLKSNRTWDLGGGIKMGVPAGMTPKEFCESSPSSPICSQVMGWSAG